MQNRIYTPSGVSFRRISEVAEVVGMENGVIQLNKIFQWNPERDTIENVSVSSKTLNQIADLSGKSLNEIRREIENRESVLKHMVRENIRSVDEVNAVLELYYRNPEKTSEAWHDGYYHCGDTAWIDEDGYFHFVGRKDDIIKSSGYRIGPYEVESAVISHPSVLECAITGFPDPVRGQIVKATIVLAKGFEASDDLAKEIQNHVKKVTAPYKYPRKIVFVDALPTTINGKIQRKVIRNQDNS
jgi:acyl-coenzyme A synthetase/AMP-(fatty) acid ligase